jgi:diguanylate cyclase (GGDEF)-like protein
MFDAALRGRLDNLNRYGWQFGLMIVDIDCFKDINDEHGHTFGDAALIRVGATLAGAVRGGDIVARWGGEEFAILVEASDAAGIAETAERVRALVAQSEVRHEGLSTVVQVSVGGSLATSDDTAESLFDRADRALYQAKRNGRNRIEIGE